MSQAADSAGIPFEGREFRPHPFEGDDGSTPPALASALRRWIAARDAGSMAAVVDALRDSRVLIPLLAEAGDLGHTPQGQVVEKTQELSIVSVAGPDGHPVALMFSDVSSLARWNPEARPVPVEVVKVAAWVMDDQMSRAVLNPASESECVLRRGAVVALLTGSDYLAPATDPDVRAEIERAFEGGLPNWVRISSGWELQRGNGPDLLVEVGLPPGLTAEQLHQLQAAWAGVWSESPLLNRRVDGIRLKILPS